MATATTTESSQVAEWLAQHRRAEKQIAKVLRRYFNAQRKRIRAGLRAAETIMPDIAAADLVRIEEEAELFSAALSEPLITIMVEGATDILNQAQQPRGTRAWDVGSLLDAVLPQRVKDAIRRMFELLTGQHWWRTIQEATQKLLQETLRKAVREGLSNEAIIDRADKTMKDANKLRVDSIATTETTTAFAIGHQAALEELQLTQVVRGKMWITAGDENVRRSHAALSGSVIRAEDKFSVGGVPAAFPGHWALPPGERINCRCVLRPVFFEVPVT